MSKGTVLFLGNIRLDLFDSLLNGYGVNGKLRSLMSGTKSLQATERILQEGTLDGSPIMCVVVYMTEFSIVHAACAPEGREIVRRILDLSRTYKHLITIYERNLHGQFSALIEDEDHLEATGNHSRAHHASNYFFHQLALNCRRWNVDWHPGAIREYSREFVQELLKDDYNILPYSTRREASVLIGNIIREAIEGTIFEIYVPKSRVLSEEFDKLISLFCKYISRVRGVEINVARDQTSRGTTYKFNSFGLDQQTFSDTMSEFRDFLNIGDGPPAVLSAIVNGSNLSGADLARISAEFQRDWRRLKLDMEIALQRRMLDLKEKYLNSVMDAEDLSELAVITAAAEARDPLRALPGSPLTVFANHVEIQVGGSTSRINSVVNQGGQNMFAHTLGTAQFSNSSDLREILDVIQQYATDSQRAALNSAVAALDDPQIDQKKRLSFAKRLEHFLLKQVLPKVGEVSTQVLVEVLKTKLVPGA